MGKRALGRGGGPEMHVALLKIHVAFLKIRVAFAALEADLRTSHGGTHHFPSHHDLPSLHQEELRSCRSGEVPSCVASTHGFV